MMMNETDKKEISIPILEENKYFNNYAIQPKNQMRSVFSFGKRSKGATEGKRNGNKQEIRM